MKPIRIQRKRTKGWQMPGNTVYVGRSTKWGNPYCLDYINFGSHEAVINAYRKWLEISLPGQAIKEEARTELRGKNLACWCPLHFPHCHADVLLEVANS